MALGKEGDSGLVVRCVDEDYDGRSVDLSPPATEAKAKKEKATLFVSPRRAEENLSWEAASAKSRFSRHRSVFERILDEEDRLVLDQLGQSTKIIKIMC